MVPIWWKCHYSNWGLLAYFSDFFLLKHTTYPRNSHWYKPSCSRDGLEREPGTVREFLKRLGLEGNEEVARSACWEGEMTVLDEGCTSHVSLTYSNVMLVFFLPVALCLYQGRRLSSYSICWLISHCACSFIFSEEGIFVRSSLHWLMDEADHWFVFCLFFFLPHSSAYEGNEHRGAFQLLVAGRINWSLAHWRATV